MGQIWWISLWFARFPLTQRANYDWWCVRSGWSVFFFDDSAKTNQHKAELLHHWIQPIQPFKCCCGRILRSLVADFKCDFVSAIAHIQSLSLGYSNEPLFSGLSLDIHAGMMLAVVGANGTGKSTFVKTVLGLHDPKTVSYTHLTLPTKRIV